MTPEQSIERARESKENIDIFRITVEQGFARGFETAFDKSHAISCLVIEMERYIQLISEDQQSEIQKELSSRIWQLREAEIEAEIEEYEKVEKASGQSYSKEIADSRSRLQSLRTSKN